MAIETNCPNDRTKACTGAADRACPEISISGRRPVMPDVRCEVMKRRGTISAALLLALGFLTLVSVPSCRAPRCKAEDSLPRFTITTSRFLGPLWNRGQADARVISHDVGYSYPADGETIWWFGDTFKGTRNADGTPRFSGGAVSCSIAKWNAREVEIPPVLDYLTGSDGTPIQAIPLLEGESWDRYRPWFHSGIYVNGASYAYYALIEIVGNDKWGFKLVGAGLAKADDPFGVHDRVLTETGWRFPVDPTFILASDGWLYLYEVEKKHTVQGLWLARVRPEDIEDPAKYEFYCGKDLHFTDDSTAYVPLREGIYGQVSIAWNAYLDRYVLASSSNLWRPTEIRFHVADHPTGPWSDVVATLDIPGRRQGHEVELVYCAYFHPELFRDDGRTMNLTYSLLLREGGFDINCEMLEFEVRLD